MGSFGLLLTILPKTSFIKVPMLYLSVCKKHQWKFIKNVKHLETSQWQKFYYWYSKGKLTTLRKYFQPCKLHIHSSCVYYDSYNYAEYWVNSKSLSLSIFLSPTLFIKIWGLRSQSSLMDQMGPGGHSPYYR